MRQKYYDVEVVREAITGAVPSISTSFHENGEMDWEAIGRNVDFLIDSGAKTLLLTYGDSVLSILTDREIFELTKYVVEKANHRAMVIGCGKKWCLSQTLEFANACAEVGCDVVIPFPPDWAQHADTNMLLKYYEAVAEKMPVMVLTNLMNGRGTPLEMFERIHAGSGIVAVKDDAPSPYGRRLGSIVRDKMAYLSGGTMEGFLNVFAYGADGYLSVFFRAFPEVDQKFWSAYTEGRLRDAVAVIDQYEIPFFKWCSANGAHFDAGIRGMIEIAGIAKRFCRIPYSYLSDAQIDALRQFLEEKGLVNN